MDFDFEKPIKFDPMSVVDQNSPNDEKVRLFRSLFGGRGDVFARRFDNAKTGKKGYSPFCENQWMRGVCGRGWNR